MSYEAASDARVMLSTAPSEEVAEKIAHALVDAKLAACVNLVPRVRSVYRWKGEVMSDAEVLLIIKTTSALAPRVAETLAGAHPYECPELLTLEVEGGLSAYLGWLRSETA